MKFDRCITGAEGNKAHITVAERFAPAFEACFGPLAHEDESCANHLKPFRIQGIPDPMHLKLCRRVCVPAAPVRRSPSKRFYGRGEASFSERTTILTHREVHHIIPLGLQSCCRYMLGHPLNLACLSPAAHRAIHLGQPDFVASLLGRLISGRPGFTGRFGITGEHLDRIHGIAA